MNIRISADSTCDLSPELIEKYDIRITPLYIVRDGQSLVDGKDITPDEIYAHVNSGGGMCSTAAVSVYDYTQFFRRQLEECDAVVHFHISGDMPATRMPVSPLRRWGTSTPWTPAVSPPASASWCWRRCS